jgi:hypothetical protein
LEKCVPVREETITGAQDLPDSAGDFLAKQPGLAAFRVDMGMGAEKWLERSNLVPSFQQLDFRVAEKASNVG